MEFQSSNTSPLSDAELAGAAQELGCSLADIKAVSHVEAPRGGFLPAPDNRPVILFESHAFHTNTGGRYDTVHPGISQPSWVHDYGAAGAHQYDRLHEAILLNREAALKSASWGKYQIMGSNFAEAGYDNVEAFIEDMCHDEGYQLDAFVAFVQNTGIDKALDSEDWRSFAYHYNGPGQVEVYATQIAKAAANG